MSVEFFRAAKLTQSQLSDISRVDVGFNYAEAAPTRSSIYGNNSPALFRHADAVRNTEAAQNYGISFGSKV